MLSKNWQQKADGSAVNWGEVRSPSVSQPFYSNLSEAAATPPPLYQCVTGECWQVPNGDADYDDGGD
jgi:hypothetical protein